MMQVYIVIYLAACQSISPTTWLYQLASAWVSHKKKCVLYCIYKNVSTAFSLKRMNRFVELMGARPHKEEGGIS